MTTRVKLGVIVLIAGLMTTFILAVVAFHRRTSARTILADIGVTGPMDLQMAIVTTGFDMFGPGGPTYLIRDREKLGMFYKRLTDPEAISPATGSYRYALVLKDNRLVLFNETSAIDLVRHNTTNRRGTYRTADLLDRPVRHTPPQVDPARIQVYKLSSKGRSAVAEVQLGRKDDKRGRRIRSIIQALVNQYDPYAVQPTSRQPVRRLTDWHHDIVFEVELTSPVTFRTLVVPEDLAIGWGNDAADVGGRMELVKADTVFVFGYDGDMVIAFRFGNQPDCIVTPFLPTKQIKGYDTNGWKILGEDLVKELLSLVTHPSTAP